MSWRRIESAPKDGSLILLACADFVDAGKFWRSQSVRNPRSRWIWNGWPERDPTHWKPLPEPPHER